MKHLESIKTFNDNGPYKRVWHHSKDRSISKIKNDFLKQKYIPCSVKDGEITVLTEENSISVEKYGTIYYFTNEEFEKVNKISDKVKELKEKHKESIRLLNEFVKSTIHHDIIKEEE